MNLFFTSLLVALGLTLVTKAFSQEDKLQELSRRIEQLELQQQELLLSSNQNKVNSFLANNLTFGGFLDSGMQAMTGPDTNFQAMNNSNILGFNVAADFSDRLHFVTQLLSGLNFPTLNPHNNPAGVPSERKFGDFFFGAILTQGYLEYTFSSTMRIQGGMGYVPFGYAPQQRELVLFQRRGGPQLIRTTNLLAQLWTGVHLLGEFSRRDYDWGYNLYTANPVDTDQSRILGVGGRLWFATPNDEIVGGLSTQYGKFRTGNNHVVGSDLRVRHERLVVTAEYAQNIIDEDDPWSAYLEPGLYVWDESLILFVFGDYAENPLNELTVQGSTIEDDYTKWEYGLGINYLPSTYTRLRLVYAMHDYIGRSAVLAGQNRDYQTLDASIGVAF